MSCGAFHSKITPLCGPRREWRDRIDDQPERLSDLQKGLCGNYLTHRPHLSMYPYRNVAAPLYTASNPSHYGRQFSSSQRVLPSTNVVWKVTNPATQSVCNVWQTQC